jgi:hypothetical protein
MFKVTGLAVNDSMRPRPRLVWRWWGNNASLEPVGAYVASVGPAMWFRPVNTRAGGEAFALATDGLLTSGRPLIRITGGWRLIELAPE